MPKPLRALILAIALLGMLGVSAAASTPAHLHLNSSTNRCDLCFTVQVSAVGTLAVHILPGLEVSGQAVLLQPYLGYVSPIAPASSSRGPPSLSL